MRITPLLFLLALAGCAQNLPETRHTISPAALDAPFPKLQPLDGLIARSQAGSTIVAQTETLTARVAFLKRKADALKGRTIIDGATRLRLLEASRRNAARNAG